MSQWRKLAILLLALVSASAAPAPAPAPETASVALAQAPETAPAPDSQGDCTGSLLGLASCLSFVIAGATDKKPDAACCSGLRDLLKQDAQSGTNAMATCMCKSFKDQASQLNLNTTRAQSLPGDCKVTFPHIANCDFGGGGGGGGGPSASPVPAHSPVALELPTGSNPPNSVAPSTPADTPQGNGAPAGSTSAATILLPAKLVNKMLFLILVSTVFVSVSI
ncbi:Non-specific lipid-transfer protein-like protein [Striga hermonthica]|uniref:Non-specific lipid-transfer protein-like protein n=1 Tax=Striga hermonthica TaxID=68872 RepID=A0A9N7RID7_STRHE|nr:Non-specific lipid-transfer protein-like protein [Striga hermonthica]